MDLLGAIDRLVPRAAAKEAYPPLRKRTDNESPDKDRFDEAMKSAGSERSDKPEEAPRPSRKQDGEKNDDSEPDSRRFLNAGEADTEGTETATGPVIELAPAASQSIPTSQDKQTGPETEAAETSKSVRAAPLLAERPSPEPDRASAAATAESKVAAKETAIIDGAPEGTAIDAANDLEAVDATEEAPVEENAVNRHKVAKSDAGTPPAIVSPKTTETKLPEDSPEKLAEARPLDAAPEGDRVSPQKQEGGASTAPTAPEAASTSTSTPQGAQGTEKIAALNALQPQPGLAAQQAGPVHSNSSVSSLTAAAAAPEAAQQVVAAIRSNVGGDKIEVRLDPPELGRVRIHFSVDRNDSVVATVSTDRSDTLDLMRRNASDLVKELERAGFANVELDFSEKSDASYSDSGADSVADADAGMIDDELTDATTFIYKRPQIEGRLDRLV